MIVLYQGMDDWQRLPYRMMQLAGAPHILALARPHWDEEGRGRWMITEAHTRCGEFQHVTLNG